MHIIILVYIWPADVKHSSLRTMAKHERGDMLPGNHEVFKKSLAEGAPFCRDIWHFYLLVHVADTVRQTWMAGRSLIFTWTDPNHPIDAMKRSVAKLQYKCKQYTTFKPGPSRFPTYGPLMQRILARCFSARSWWTQEAPLCWACLRRCPDLDRHWVQVLRLCTCVNDENIRRSWRWLLYVLNLLNVLYVLYVLCILILLFCFGRMAEVNWIPDFIRAGPQKPRIYVVPVDHILGKLPLVPVGDTGTI